VSFILCYPLKEGRVYYLFSLLYRLMYMCPLAVMSCMSTFNISFVGYVCNCQTVAIQNEFWGLLRVCVVAVHAAWANSILARPFPALLQLGSKPDTLCDSTRLMSFFASGLNRGRRGRVWRAVEWGGGKDGESRRDIVV